MIATAVLVLAFALAMVTSALAQAPPCGPREAVLGYFATRYGESPVSIGVTNQGSLLEVLASRDGSWTIVLTQPGGLTCVLLSGEGWRQAPVRTIGDPAT